MGKGTILATVATGAVILCLIFSFVTAVLMQSDGLSLEQGSASLQLIAYLDLLRTDVFALSALDAL